MKPDRAIPNPAIAALILAAMAAGTGTSPARPALAQAPPPGPGVWWVAVGVDDFDSPDTRWPPARGTRDAIALDSKLANELGWGSARGLLLLDDGAPAPVDPALGGARRLRATRANLEWALGDWLPSRIKPGDLVLLAFAGHPRVAGPAKPGLAPPEPSLLLRDANPSDPNATGARVGPRLAAIAAKGARVLVWIDASPIGRGAPTPNPNPGDDPARTLAESIALAPGISVWIASRRPTPPLDDRGASIFGKLVRDAIGTRDRPADLLAALDRLRRDLPPDAGGPVVVGGLEPGRTLANLATAARAAAFTPRPVLQRGHAANVRAAVLAPDLDTLLTASDDSTARVWSARDGELREVHASFRAGVEALALSRDGRYFAAGDRFGTVVFRDRLADREIPWRGPPPHETPIRSLAFLPDAPRALSRDQTGRIVLWTISPDPNEPDRARLEARTILPSGSKSLSPIRTDPAGEVRALILDRGGNPKILVGAETDPADLPRSREVARRAELSPDGARAVVETETNRLRVLELPSGTPIRELPLPGPLTALDVGARLVAFAAGSEVRVLPTLGDAAAIPPPPRSPLPIPDRVPRGEAFDRLILSENETALAARSARAGKVALWKLPEGTPIELPPEVDAEPVTTVLPLADLLFLGDRRGGIRLRRISDRAEDGGAGVFAIPPHRNRIASLDADRTGTRLLERGTDGRVRVWNLSGDTGPKPIPGLWTDAALLADASVVAAPESGGSPRIFDPAGAEVRLAEPDDEDRIHASVRSSPSGTRIAALDSNNPVVHVWNRDRPDAPPLALETETPATALAFAGESTLIVADGEGLLRFDLNVDRAAEADSNSNSEPDRIGIAALGLDEDDATITAIATHPRRPEVLAIAGGELAGRVSLLRWRPEGASPPVRIGESGRRTAWLGFAPDGSKLIAAGDQPRPQVWTIDAEAPDRLGATASDWSIDPAHAHDERAPAGAWIATPAAAGGLLSTGSDDGTIRLWSIGEPRPRAILSGADPARGDWLVHTPEAWFDGSVAGGDAIRWRLPNGRSARLDQIERARRRPGLLAELRAGRRPPEVSATPWDFDARAREAPRIDLFGPDRPPASGRDVELRVRVDDPTIPPDRVRVLQNGRPVPGLIPTPDAPGEYRVLARLEGGSNVFHAMAGAPGAVDGRSRELALAWNAPTPPGRVHFVAVGISNYRGALALNHADRDARAVAARLRALSDRIDAEAAAGACAAAPASSGANDKDDDDNEIDAPPPERILLTNDEATEPAIRDAMLRVARATRGRPEDKVIFYFAGHARVFGDAFHLVLPDCPENPAEPVEGGTIPYARIAFDLERTPALNRWVVLDVCEARAAIRDPSVARLRNRFAAESRGSRFDFLLAAGGDNATRESDRLGHGFLTAALLRTLGAALESEPPGGWPTLTAGLPESLDENGDGWIATDEVRNRAAAIHARLLARMADDRGPARGTPNPPAAGTPVANPPPPDPEPLGDGAGFPLWPASEPDGDG